MTGWREIVIMRPEYPERYQQNLNNILKGKSQYTHLSLFGIKFHCRNKFSTLLLKLNVWCLLCKIVSLLRVRDVTMIDGQRISHQAHRTEVGNPWKEIRAFWCSIVGINFFKLHFWGWDECLSRYSKLFSNLYGWITGNSEKFVLSGRVSQ